MKTTDCKDSEFYLYRLVFLIEKWLYTENISKDAMFFLQVKPWIHSWTRTGTWYSRNWGRPWKKPSEKCSWSIPKASSIKFLIMASSYSKFCSALANCNYFYLHLKRNTFILANPLPVVAQWKHNKEIFTFTPEPTLLSRLVIVLKCTMRWQHYTANCK